CFFFFQAEDGIRDFHVTGVQTCALPIWFCSALTTAQNRSAYSAVGNPVTAAPSGPVRLDGRRRLRVPDPTARRCVAAGPNCDPRSEERRVGKERRSQVGCEQLE